MDGIFNADIDNDFVKIYLDDESEDQVL